MQVSILIIKYPNFILIVFLKYIYIKLTKKFNSYSSGKIPRQGHLYLSLNHLCFYSYMFGNETKLVLRFVILNTYNEYINTFFLIIIYIYISITDIQK